MNFIISFNHWELKGFKHKKSIAFVAIDLLCFLSIIQN